MISFLGKKINQMLTSPLLKIVFIQKVALFAGSTPAKALELAYVAPEWREAVLEYSFDYLICDPFAKAPLFRTNLNQGQIAEKQKQDEEEREKLKLKLFGQFRKVIPFVFRRVSLIDQEKDEIVKRMKLLLAFLFDFVHNRGNNRDHDDANHKQDNVENDVFRREVASFLCVHSLLSFLRLHEIHALIINHIAPHVTAIDKFGSLICDIVRTRQSAEIFSNIESFSAILKCFHRSKTSEEARWIASSIDNILYYNPRSIKLLNSLPVVEAFSFVIPLASNAEAVRWISNALMKIFNNNEEAEKKFGTPEFFKIFKGTEKHATTDESKTAFQSVLGFVDPTDYSKPLADATNSCQLKFYVNSLPRHEKYFAKKFRDLLIAKKNLIAEAETADSVVKFLRSFSEDESRRPLLRTKEVHDLIINHIAPYVTAIYEFGRMIRNIVRDQRAADLFSKVESFSAILKCFHRSKTSLDALWIAGSLNNIVSSNPSSNILFNSLPVVEAFSFIIPLANDYEAVRWISNALLKIFNNNEEAQQKFGTPEFFRIFRGMENHANSPLSKSQFEKVVQMLSKNKIYQLNATMLVVSFAMILFSLFFGFVLLPAIIRVVVL